MTVQQAFEQHVMHTYARFSVVFERGEGCYLEDSEGRRYLDFVAGIATCVLGHAHPVLSAAIAEQARALIHVSNLYYTPQQARLAEWLTAHSAADQVFFCNSGAEANEGAIKLARKYGRTVLGIAEPQIISAHQSFHGRTMATVTATGQPKYQKHFHPLVPGFVHVPYNDFEALRAQVTDATAAVLIEPIQGEGGVVPGDVEFFQKLRRFCSERRILLMLDEVQTGMGRTGRLFGYEHLGIEPDVFTLAKALGGGVPIGALCAKDVFAIFEPGDHASTFGGNPLACAAALAVCQTLEAEHLVNNARERGAQLAAGLGRLVERFKPLVRTARGRGLMQGLVLSEPRAAEIVRLAMEQGLLLVSAGPEVIRFVPPLIVSAIEVDEALAILEGVFARLPVTVTA
ncbi:acetylornithine transaminase [Gloeobacter morelensis]|uniref:Acetylornithine aminotransferase n=1 Tax=Gloeobacter morelensis MG652769 TaxID=2781736 RepID=A0ABY3PI83_9CYAN|nr:acetylornithine transaminase [Gloeobacter morelensis]UFP93388.1 acetylornithine transaminase [Gloeobacter morelensis MG652769]